VRQANLMVYLAEELSRLQGGIPFVVVNKNIQGTAIIGRFKFLATLEEPGNRDRWYFCNLIHVR